MFVDVNGQRLHAVSFGSGPRTLVAHGGWIGNWELWQQPFELLSPEWRCISYDHRGSGESPVAPEALTPQALVDDLFGVLDAFGVDRCVVAGESLGALAALQAVQQQPHRFEGLVLVDGTSGVTDEAVRPLVDGCRADFDATIGFFVDACVPEADSAHLRRWGRDMLRRAEPEAAARMFECYLEDPPAIDLGSIDVSALVLHGTDDLIVPVAVGEAVAAALPDAVFVPLAGAGHVPTVTRPHQVVDAIRERFGG